MATFYTGVDQERYDAGNKYLPQDRFLLNYQAPTTNYSTSNTTTKIDTRLRARSIALKIANTTSSEDWKLGTFRLDIHPGGRR